MQKNRFSHHLILFILSFLFTLFVQNAYAEVSIATASQNLLGGPVNIFTHTVYNMCYVIAITMLVASIAQYRSYWLNPNQTALNRPVILLLLAVAVALMPTLAKLSEAEPYTHL